MVTVVEDCRVAMVPQRHHTVEVLTGAVERAGVAGNIVRLTAAICERVWVALRDTSFWLRDVAVSASRRGIRSGVVTCAVSEVTD